MRQSYIFCRLLIQNVRNMSVFTRKLNLVTGKWEWELQDEGYDFHQEIARASFADMLHDTERNQKYYIGIELAIQKMHERNKEAHVLDIGTGTGLLSMMAVKCGADSVVACEAFRPIANCAKEIIMENGFSNNIKLISKRSTDIRVGTDGDMEHRANILVTEIFDTELIGEGALTTFHHAQKELLEENSIIVPSSATVFAQIVESDLVQRWNKLFPIYDPANGEILVRISDEVSDCPGAAAVHDIQLSQLPPEQFKSIAKPFPIFKFDWSGRIPFDLEECNRNFVKCEVKGTAQIVFMWWELAMDVDEKVILSCAPIWAHPAPSDPLPWRDHWMQGVYYLPKEVKVEKGDEITLVSTHDEYSLWFNIEKSDIKESLTYKSPVCSCGLHFSLPRTRVGGMNDIHRISKYLKVLKKKIKNDSIILCLSDGSLLGLLAAQLGAKKVFCREDAAISQRFLNSCVEENNLQHKIKFIRELNEVDEKITLIIGDPYFFSSILPWQNIHFWFLTSSARQEFGAAGADTVPCKVTVWGMAVEFDNLWKIRAPLYEIEGFKVGPFDDLIEKSCSISDSEVEAQPLWEYPCRSLSEPFVVMEFDVGNNVDDLISLSKSGNVTCKGTGICHGVALWSDWHLDSNTVITNGPVESPIKDKYVLWDMYTRQGVYFIHKHPKVQPETSLGFKADFDKSTGEIGFSFTVGCYKKL